MNTKELFNKDMIITKLKADNPNDVIMALYEKLLEKNYVKKSFLDAIISREKTYPTGLKLNNYNIAIPHTESKHVIKSIIAIATLHHPVLFKRMDDSETDVGVSAVFMIALNGDYSQVEMLSQLIRMVQNDVLLQKIIDSNNGNEIIDNLDKIFIS